MRAIIEIPGDGLLAAQVGFVMAESAANVLADEPEFEFLNAFSAMRKRPLRGRRKGGGDSGREGLA